MFLFAICTVGELRCMSVSALYHVGWFSKRYARLPNKHLQHLKCLHCVFFLLHHSRFVLLQNYIICITKSFVEYGLICHGPSSIESSPNLSNVHDISQRQNQKTLNTSLKAEISFRQCAASVYRTSVCVSVSQCV